MTRCLVLLLALTCIAATRLEAAEPPLAHMVFFTLREDSQENRSALVAVCHKYLSGHEGTLHFSVGTRAAEFDRDVNDKEFHVSLHMVFENKAAHDKYHPHARHLKFIEENRHLWDNVRVFDSYLTPPAQQ